MDCLLGAFCVPATLCGSALINLPFFFSDEETHAYREVKCLLSDLSRSHS